MAARFRDISAFILNKSNDYLIVTHALRQFGISRHIMHRSINFNNAAFSLRNFGQIEM